MAANDDFPRAQTIYSFPGANAQAVCTFPASPGIEWVLESVQWYTDATGETIAQAGIMEVITIQTQIFIGIYYVLAEAGLQIQQGDWEGNIPGGVGEALTVAFQGGLSGAAELLIATAYPT